MALPSELTDEVAAARPQSSQSPAKRRKAERSARRTEAMTLRMAGLTYEQIGARLGIKPRTARDLVERTLYRAEVLSVDRLREMENARLDRAQAAIWSGVLNGEPKAIDSFLRISQARRALNGLNAPTQLNVAISIRSEMEAALLELEALVDTPKMLEMEPLSVEDERRAIAQFGSRGAEDAEEESEAS